MFVAGRPEQRHVVARSRCDAAPSRNGGLIPGPGSGILDMIVPPNSVVRRSA
jgi:hypothetical protein